MRAWTTVQFRWDPDAVFEGGFCRSSHKILEHPNSCAFGNVMDVVHHKNWLKTQELQASPAK